MGIPGSRPLAFLALLALAAWQAPGDGQDREVELTYLANEGFLVRAGEHEVLIDAFVAEPYSIYAALPAEMHAAMMAGEPPFHAVDLALTSHVHRDHFQPPCAAEFLSSHEETIFLSTPDVLEELRAELAGDVAMDRARALLPEPGRSLRFDENGLSVEVLRLPHGVTDNGVQNLGLIVDLGGTRLLHVGDSDVRAEDFLAYDLPRRGIDVAFLPYWCLLDEESVRLARERTGARHLVAVHVPPRELAEQKARLARLAEDLLLFERAGEQRTLRCGPR